MKTMTREQAVNVLAAHSFTPTVKTAYKIVNGKAEYQDGSSFDAMVGVKETYTRTEVYEWLGY